jgi:cell division septal protein FtsQ
MNTRHHHLVSVLFGGVLILGIVLGMISPVSQWDSFSLRSQEHIAGVVGMSVGVDPNPHNSLAQDLAQREAELDVRAREMDRREREIRTMIEEESAKNDRKLIVLISLITILLLSLIVLNFLLDQRRRQGKQKTETERGLSPTIHHGEFTTKL